MLSMIFTVLSFFTYTFGNISCNLALKHPWLKQASSPKQKLHRRHSSECIGGAYGTTKMAPHLSLDIQICKSIEMFSTYSWLHRLALMVIGYKYTGKETTGKYVKRLVFGIGRQVWIVNRLFGLNY